MDLTSFEYSNEDIISQQTDNVIGWGKDKRFQLTNEMELFAALLRIYSFADCTRALPSIALLLQQMFCTKKKRALDVFKWVSSIFTDSLEISILIRTMEKNLDY